MESAIDEEMGTTYFDVVGVVRLEEQPMLLEFALTLSAGDMSGLIVIEEPLSELRFEKMVEAS